MARKKLDMTPPQHKILGESATERSKKLIAHTKSVIDDMIKEGIPLTVERVSLRAGCSKSFIYKNKEIKDYINNSKQEPTMGKRTYTTLEEAQKRIKELEVENTTLRLKNIGLFKQATNLYTQLANIIELNIYNMEQEMEDDEKNSAGIVNHQKQRSYEIYDKVYRTLYDMIIRDEKINYYTVAKEAEVSRTYLYKHNAFSMMIDIFSNLQKQNESESMLMEKFEQAQNRYKELQQKYKEVKTKYDVWNKENII